MASKATFERVDNQDTNDSRRPRSQFWYKCFRINLAISVGLTVLTALAFIAVGIVPLDFYFKTYISLEFAFNFTYIKTGAAVCIVVGFLLLITCVIGVFGMVKLNRCVLILFVVTLAILSCSITMRGVSCIKFRNEVTMDIIIKDNYTKAITERYGVDIANNPTNKLFTEVVDSIQETFKCCGSYGDVSGVHSWALYKTKSHWYYSSVEKYPMVPRSCCVKDGDIDICGGRKHTSGPPRFGPGMGLSPARYVNDHIHTDGCYDQVVKKSQDYLFYFGIAVLSTVLFPVIATAMAVCLACFIY